MEFWIENKENSAELWRWIEKCYNDHIEEGCSLCPYEKECTIIWSDIKY